MRRMSRAAGALKTALGRRGSIRSKILAGFTVTDNLTNSERPFQTAFLLRFEVDFRFSSTFHMKRLRAFRNENPLTQTQSFDSITYYKL